jgi:hypothetical protein
MGASPPAAGTGLSACIFCPANRSKGYRFYPLRIPRWSLFLLYKGQIDDIQFYAPILAGKEGKEEIKKTAGDDRRLTIQKTGLILRP